MYEYFLQKFRSIYNPKNVDEATIPWQGGLKDLGGDPKAGT